LLFLFPSLGLLGWWQRKRLRKSRVCQACCYCLMDNGESVSNGGKKANGGDLGLDELKVRTTNVQINAFYNFGEHVSMS